MLRFSDRRHAGEKLAEKLREKLGSDRKDLVFLALPRGGIPIAVPCAQAFDAPVDVLVARKIGAPGHDEFAIGAITEHGTRLLNEEPIQYLRVSDHYLEKKSKEQLAVAKERASYLRGGRPPVDVTDKTCVVIDDGVATGMTMKAAIEDLKSRRPKRIIAAAPVIAHDTVDELRRAGAEVVCVAAPVQFYAVGQFYHNFTQVEDHEAKHAMDQLLAKGAPGCPTKTCPTRPMQ